MQAFDALSAEVMKIKNITDLTLMYEQFYSLSSYAGHLTASTHAYIKCSLKDINLTKTEV